MTPQQKRDAAAALVDVRPSQPPSPDFPDDGWIPQSGDVVGYALGSGPHRGELRPAMVIRPAEERDFPTSQKLAQFDELLRRHGLPPRRADTRWPWRGVLRLKLLLDAELDGLEDHVVWAAWSPEPRDLHWTPRAWRAVEPKPCSRCFRAFASDCVNGVIGSTRSLVYPSMCVDCALLAAGRDAGDPLAAGEADRREQMAFRAEVDRLIPPRAPVPAEDDVARWPSNAYVAMLAQLPVSQARDTLGTDVRLGRFTKEQAVDAWSRRLNAVMVPRAADREPFDAEAPSPDKRPEMHRRLRSAKRKAMAMAGDYRPLCEHCDTPVNDGDGVTDEHEAVTFHRACVPAEELRPAPAEDPRERTAERMREIVAADGVLDSLGVPRDVDGLALNLPSRVSWLAARAEEEKAKLAAPMRERIGESLDRLVERVGPMPIAEAREPYRRPWTRQVSTSWEQAGNPVDDLRAVVDRSMPPTPMMWPMDDRLGGEPLEITEDIVRAARGLTPPSVVVREGAGITPADFGAALAAGVAERAAEPIPDVEAPPWKHAPEDDIPF